MVVPLTIEIRNFFPFPRTLLLLLNNSPWNFALTKFRYSANKGSSSLRQFIANLSNDITTSHVFKNRANFRSSLKKLIQRAAVVI